jgi:ABC-type transport system involved in multi-copper enzyme maturation permease subunit
MSEAIINDTEARKNRLALPGRLRRNPIVVKELRGRMRGNRAFVLITIYLALLAGGIGIIFLSMLTARNSPSAVDVRQMMGKAIFWVVVSMELLTVSFIAPALTAGAISSEREHQTYDILRASLLPARSLVFGKLFTALSFIFLLLFAALPLQSLAFLFGGVAVEEFLIASLLLVVSALAFSSIGILFSSLTKRTLVSTVLTYGAAIMVIFGLPILVFILASVFQSFVNNLGNQMNVTTETLLVLGGWLLISINPLATAVVTEAILINEQSAFYFAFPLSGGATFPILSPWISYTLFYLLLSAVLILLSIHFVKRRET